MNIFLGFLVTVISVIMVISAFFLPLFIVSIWDDGMREVLENLADMCFWWAENI